MGDMEMHLLLSGIRFLHTQFPRGDYGFFLFLRARRTEGAGRSAQPTIPAGAVMRL